MMLQAKNLNKVLLAALLVGAASTALAGTSCGTNLEYELEGTTLVLTSPDPASPATVYASAFLNRTDFTDVIIPDNVTEISTSAFQGCTGITEVVLPPSVTNIGNYAFNGCSNLHWVFCRPQTPPTLDPSGSTFVDCASDLVFCVPKLNYKSAEGWSFYEPEQFQFCFLDENDEQSVVSDKLATFRSASLTGIDIFRTLRKAGCFNTLTLPFSVPDIASSPLAGAEVYEFVSATVSEGTLWLNIAPLAGNSLSYGTPYLIQWSNTGEVLNRMHFTGVTWDPNDAGGTSASTDVNYVGFYGKTHISDDADHSNLFLAGNNELYWPSDGGNETAKMLGFRAYFHAVTGGAALSPVRKGMPAVLRIQSTPTDISTMYKGTMYNVQSDDVPCTKELRNGQIIIIRNGEQYSITGQRL